MPQIVGKDQSPSKASVPKASGSKTHRKKIDAVDGRSTRVQIESLPMLPPSEFKEFDPHDIKDSQIAHAPHDLDPPIPEGNHETFVECLFSKVILSLLAPNVSDFFSKEEPSRVAGVGETMVEVLPIETIETLRITSTDTSKAVLDEPLVFEVIGTYGTAPVGDDYQGSALDDYDLESKAFSNFFYLIDASKLLIEPLRMKRQKALDYFIRLAHYLNGFIENSVDLSDKAIRFEVESIILKRTKDQLSKAIGEASDRAEAAERKAKDAEELKARVVKVEAFEAEALLVVKIAEEKALKAINDFQVSKEFRKEKASFALDAYDEGKHVVCEEVASKYPGLDLGFLDEVLGAFASDPEDTS
ncbi:hypothetical protein COCNU_scaffold012362G000010 [Cocos nucifera]|nr:hypothetical protein [Cocos nucifera]